jgi:hypothetical protein
MDAAWKIFALIGFAIVGIGVYVAYSTFEKVKAVASWPTVPGYVAESAVVWEAEERSVDGGHRYSYLLKVRTEYLIDGQNFSTTTPGIKEIRDTQFFRTDPWKIVPDKAMIGLFKQVPQGTMVPVYYNPEKKAESYIFAKLPFWDLYSLPFFVILAGMPFLLLSFKLAH